jgi:hypothetical protein
LKIQRRAIGHSAQPNHEEIGAHGPVAALALAPEYNATPTKITR